SLSCTTGTQPLYTLTQVQHGPVRKDPADPSIQGDYSNDSFIINQSSTQNNDTGNDQTNIVQGDCSTSGSCTATQTTNENAQQTQTTQSVQIVNSSINCNTWSSCTATPPLTPSFSYQPTIQH